MNTDDTDEGENAGLSVAHLRKPLPHSDVTEAIIGAAFEVHNELGHGYLERVYQNALQVELVRHGRRAETERRISVLYKGVVVGDYVAEMVVDECVLVELKVAPCYDRRDAAQLLNELKATKLQVGLLINFGRSKVEFKRLVL